MDVLAKQARNRLIEVGGSTSHDLGLGRLVGQILVYHYLSDGECSLEQTGKDLGLSKAAVSVAVRQLEAFGLLRRAWKQGDRKKYYRSADNIATALQQGIVAFFGRKINSVGLELDVVNEMLGKAGKSSEVRFLQSRVKRTRSLQGRMSGLLNNNILKLLVKL